MCFYVIVISQVNVRVTRNTNNVNKSKGISGSGICKLGGTLADFETGYYYQISHDRYFAGISEMFLARYLHGADAASDTYDEKLGAITTYGVYSQSLVGTVAKDTGTLKEV